MAEIVQLILVTSTHVDVLMSHPVVESLQAGTNRASLLYLTRDFHQTFREGREQTSASPHWHRAGQWIQKLYQNQADKMYSLQRDLSELSPLSLELLEFHITPFA